MNCDLTFLVKRFEDVSNDAIKSLLEESDYNFDAKMAITSHRDNNKIKIGNYTIIVKKENIYDIEKNYYDIYFNDELVEKDVSLFMTVIKFIQKNKPNMVSTDIKNLLQFDKHYDMIFSDLAYQKKLIQNTKDQNKKELYIAKYDGMWLSLARIKSQIIKIT